MSTAAPAPAAAERGNRKRVVGIVVSDKMQKTRVVAVTELFKHPQYGERSVTTTIRGSTPAAVSVDFTKQN